MSGLGGWGRGVLAVVGLALLALGYPLRVAPEPVSCGLVGALLGVVSASASLPVATGVGVVVGLACWGRGCWGWAGRFLAGLLLGGLLVWGLKLLLLLPRPGEAPGGLLGADEYAYPSGHSFFAWLAACCLRGTRAWGLGLAWAVLVLASRVLLGAHYLGDVVAGAGLALLVSALVGVCIPWQKPR